MSKTFVCNLGPFLRAAGALAAVGFLPAVLPAGQSLAGGADLFAPSREVGRKLDAERALPITSFYATEGLKTGAKPGTLVRSEPAGDYALPPGITTTRVLYHTRTASNTDAIASGVVVVLSGRSPKGGWPLVAWCPWHGWRCQCAAPPLMKSLFYNWEGLYEYVLMAYAVVATEYTGLGTPGRHAYLDMLSNGMDVINSAPAARAAVPDLGKMWLVVGHLREGSRAWALLSWKPPSRTRIFWAL